MINPVRTSAPSDTPVSLTEVKAHCRVDATDSDTVLAIYLAAAIAQLDGWDGILTRCLVTQTWRQDFAGFDNLYLPLGPVASISSVTYYDADGASQTLADTVYELKHDDAGTYVGLKADQDWPSVEDRDDGVRVTFVAGTAVDAVPAPLKAAILLMVGDLYANRETAVVGATAVANPMTPTVDRLIAPFRQVRL